VVTLALVLELDQAIVQHNVAERETRRRGPAAGAVAGRERSEIEAAVFRNLDMQRGTAEPQFGNHPCSAQQRAPFEIDEAMRECDDRPAVHVVERDVGRRHGQGKRIEREFADAHAQLQLIFNQAWQFALGEPRRSQEAGRCVGERQQQGNAGGDQVTATGAARWQLRLGLLGHDRWLDGVQFADTVADARFAKRFLRGGGFTLQMRVGSCFGYFGVGLSILDRAVV